MILSVQRARTFLLAILLAACAPLCHAGLSFDIEDDSGNKIGFIEFAVASFSASSPSASTVDSVLIAFEMSNPNSAYGSEIWRNTDQFFGIFRWTVNEVDMSVVDLALGVENDNNVFVDLVTDEVIGEDDSFGISFVAAESAAVPSPPALLLFGAAVLAALRRRCV